MIEMGPAGGRSFDFERAGASPKKGRLQRKLRGRAGYGYCILQNLRSILQITACSMDLKICIILSKS